MEEWNDVRNELKERFFQVGILSCEVQYPKCTRASNFGWTWSFAHSLKRNQITREPEQRRIEMREVVYACGSCHAQLEAIGNKPRDDGKPTMAEIVCGIIQKRRVQP